MNANYFILNGPMAAYELPADASNLTQRLPNGHIVHYEPAPVFITYATGPSVMLLGSKVTILPSGNAMIAHPQWIPTLIKPSTGELRECDGVPVGFGMHAS